ncbi:MAG: hypothetical protein IPM59_02575 [Chloracidobacterium sp.]|nr:hypothetical protein [Chloracidobacterium sp.]
MLVQETRSSACRRLSAALFAAVSLLFVRAAVGQAPAELNMLVVGDSHIAGQGLKPEHKSYTLVKEWLENDSSGSPRKVNLKVKAHGGARLNLHADELAAMQKAGDDITIYRYPEANISQPSIRMQIDDARREYASGDDVDLVMMSGCITDVLVGNIINPFVSEKRLGRDIKQYCGEALQGILEHIAATFPRARIVVVGYFPVASRKAKLKKIPPYFLRIVSYPRSLQGIFTNVVTRQIFRPLRRKLAKRSALWMREYEREARGAIDRANARFDKPRVLFVPSPITADRSYGTKDSLLWEVGMDQRPNDETYEERLVGCARVFSELKFQHYGRFSLRMCELSSAAHPNVEGSRAFAEAIEDKLKSIY